MLDVYQIQRLIKLVKTKHHGPFSDYGMAVSSIQELLGVIGDMGDHLQWLEVCLDEYPYPGEKPTSVRAALDKIEEQLTTHADIISLAREGE